MLSLAYAIANCSSCSVRVCGIVLSVDSKERLLLCSLSGFQSPSFALVT
jgi:hypothetical protein